MSLDGVAFRQNRAVFDPYSLVLRSTFTARRRHPITMIRWIVTARCELRTEPPPFTARRL